MNTTPTAYYSPPDCALHEGAKDHLETPLRTAAITDQLERSGTLQSLNTALPTQAGAAALDLARHAAHVAQIFSVDASAESVVLDRGGSTFRDAVAASWLPQLNAFRPELIVVSAGFDAHAADPPGQLELDEADFAWVTEEMMTLARRHAGGRLVSTLEGGYDLTALAASAQSHVESLPDH